MKAPIGFTSLRSARSSALGRPDIPDFFKIGNICRPGLSEPPDCSALCASHLRRTRSYRPAHPSLRTSLIHIRIRRSPTFLSGWTGKGSRRCEDCAVCNEKDTCLRRPKEPVPLESLHAHAGLCQWEFNRRRSSKTKVRPTRIDSDLWSITSGGRFAC